MTATKTETLTLTLDPEALALLRKEARLALRRADRAVANRQERIEVCRNTARYYRERGRRAEAERESKGELFHIERLADNKAAAAAMRRAAEALGAI